MTLFSLAEYRERNIFRRQVEARRATLEKDRLLETAVDDVDALIEEIQRLRSIRLPSGNDL